MTAEALLLIICSGVAVGIVWVIIVCIGLWVRNALQASVAMTLINGFILQVGNDPQKIRELCNLRDPKGRLVRHYEHMSEHIDTVNRQH